jgi:two-component system nitrate/nitrite response regulator NarP
VLSDRKIRIALYSQQPFAARGLAAVLRAEPDLELTACRDSLAGAIECLKSARPDVLLVHLLSGISLSDLREMRSADGRCQIVIWGQDVGGDFASQAMQLGIRSILPGNAPIGDFLAALRNVYRGVLCFDPDLMESMLSQTRVALTARQGQIVMLVAQGFKNRDIALSMGITEGTLKVYLYKLFKKLGMNNRLDMALYGRKNLFSGRPGLERTTDCERSGPLAVQAIKPRPLLLVSRKLPAAPVVN